MNASTPQHVRWLKFSFVGAIGIGVQLGALSLFIRLHFPYLLATALAVACAVLHNFIWHEASLGPIARKARRRQRYWFGCCDFAWPMPPFRLSETCC
jgi:hypothetical protein